jgi:hypothetical protein
MPELQRQLVQRGLEALRDPETERKVDAHLKAQGGSQRDLIAVALLAARFHREPIQPCADPETPSRRNGVSQSA